jgi:hypothetical protein
MISKAARLSSSAIHPVLEARVTSAVISELRRELLADGADLRLAFEFGFAGIVAELFVGGCFFGVGHNSDGRSGRSGISGEISGSFRRAFGDFRGVNSATKADTPVGAEGDERDFVRLPTGDAQRGRIVSGRAWLQAIGAHFVADAHVAPDPIEHVLELLLAGGASGEAGERIAALPVDPHVGDGSYLPLQIVLHAQSAKSGKVAGAILVGEDLLHLFAAIALSGKSFGMVRRTGVSLLKLSGTVRSDSFTAPRSSAKERKNGEILDNKRRGHATARLSKLEADRREIEHWQRLVTFPFSALAR